MTGKGDQLTELAHRIKDSAKGHIKIQTAWATVKEVDWEERAMTATGLTDGLEFFDVSLGMGAIAVKPKVGSACLIGLVENQEAAAFLIDAEQVEEYALTVTDKVSIKNDAENLADLISTLIDEITKMKFTTNTGVTIKLVNRLQFLNLKTKFKNLLK